MVELNSPEQSNDATIESQSSNADSAPASRQLDRRRRRSIAAAALLVGLVGVGIWQVKTHSDYWRAAWEQRSLSPIAVDAGAPPTGSQPREHVALYPPTPTTFDLSRVTIPREEIRSGGPPKDGIPAITKPHLIEVQHAHYLRPGDRVIGVVDGQEARAYPLRILNYHEIVNDRIGQTPIAVTYCPLCDSAAVFDRRTKLGEREFGVSGLLYNSNVLMYDRSEETESLWSQLKTDGVTGPAADVQLKSLPLELTTWKEWVARHPNTKVLSTDTGHRRDYSTNPYRGYFLQPQLMFPVSATSDRLAVKEKVLGVWTGSTARAYPYAAFSRENPRVEDQLDGRKVVIEFNPDAQSVRVVEADDDVQWMYSLWFAWYAFRPHTTTHGQ